MSAITGRNNHRRITSGVITHNAVFTKIDALYSHTDTVDVVPFQCRFTVYKSCCNVGSTYMNLVSMLVHRLRRWPNIKTTLGSTYNMMCRPYTCNSFYIPHWPKAGIDADVCWPDRLHITGQVFLEVNPGGQAFRWVSLPGATWATVKIHCVTTTGPAASL